MNRHCKMCNMEFTPTGKLKEYQLFCDEKCMDAWMYPPRKIRLDDPTFCAIPKCGGIARCNSLCRSHFSSMYFHTKVSKKLKTIEEWFSTATEKQLKKQ